MSSQRHKEIQNMMFVATAGIILTMLAYSTIMTINGNFLNYNFPIADNLISLAAVVVVIRSRNFLNLKNYTVALACLFLLLHNFGSLGPYGWKFGVIRYDRAMHLFSGIVLFFAFLEFLKLHFGNASNPTGKYQDISEYDTLVAQKHDKAIITMCVLGPVALGSLTEIIEFVSGYYFNNPGDGLFFYGAGDIGEWQDAIFDMVNNFLGALVGLFFYALQKKPALNLSIQPDPKF